jgi:hypothetical protein
VIAPEIVVAIHTILIRTAYNFCMIAACRMRSFYKYFVIAAICLVVLEATGCGSHGPKMIPIHGDVSYNGAPLVNVTQGIVRYSPKQIDPLTREATGRIQPDGSFVLTTFQKGDGVVEGEYDITVSAYSSPGLTREQTESGERRGAPKLMIPEKYLKSNTSGLSDSVKAGHSGYKKLELKD